MELKLFPLTSKYDRFSQLLILKLDKLFCPQEIVSNNELFEIFNSVKLLSPQNKDSNNIF